MYVIKVEPYQLLKICNKIITQVSVLSCVLLTLTTCTGQLNKYSCDYFNEISWLYTSLVNDICYVTTNKMWRNSSIKRGKCGQWLRWCDGRLDSPQHSEHICHMTRGGRTAGTQCGLHSPCISYTFVLL